MRTYAMEIYRTFRGHSMYGVLSNCLPCEAARPRWPCTMAANDMDLTAQPPNPSSISVQRLDYVPNRAHLYFQSVS